MPKEQRDPGPTMRFSSTASRSLEIDWTWRRDYLNQICRWNLRHTRWNRKAWRGNPYGR